MRNQVQNSFTDDNFYLALNGAANSKKASHEFL